MFTKRIILAVPLLLGSLATTALAHEVWLEPDRYQVETGAALSVQLKNGEAFEGINLAWFDRRIARFERLQNGTVTEVAGRSGDIPAVQIADADSGLLVLAYESTPSTVTYREWDKFTAFVSHKDLHGTLDAHNARGLPQENFKELYSRHAKALIAAGDGAGSDRELGLVTEFVALKNPYTDPIEDGLPVQLLYQGAPRGDAQIEIFARAPDGAITITTTRTDAAGRAVIPVKPGHEYLLDAVVMREPAPDVAAEKKAAWESLWAALSFRVPD